MYCVLSIDTGERMDGGGGVVCTECTNLDTDPEARNIMEDPDMSVPRGEHQVTAC